MLLIVQLQLLDLLLLLSLQLPLSIETNNMLLLLWIDFCLVGLKGLKVGSRNLHQIEHSCIRRKFLVPELSNTADQLHLTILVTCKFLVQVS